MGRLLPNFAESWNLMRDPNDERLHATVSRWIDGLRDGDERSASELWRRYFRRLVAFSDKKLHRGGGRGFDAEDVALSAFRSLCLGVRDGRFPDVVGRDELWSLLAVIAARKTCRRMRDENAAKRGGGGEPDTAEITAILGREPTPEFAAEFAEESERLLARLDDDALRDVALRKLEGYTNEEIARDVPCAVRTVERRLALIRRIWIERDE